MQNPTPRLKTKSFQSRQKTRATLISNYQIKETIGKGGFAKVKRATHLPTGQTVAVKIVSKNNLCEEDVKKVHDEVEVQRSLHHQNITRIYEVVETDEKIFIFMEYCINGEVFEFINRNGPLEENEAAKIFIQVVSAVRYLHDQKIAHRDIKTENILLDHKMNVKLIDFGLAKKFGAGKGQTVKMLNTFCGSPSYTSPEIVVKNRYDAELVDVWCLGVTLYVMLSASLPFGSTPNQKLKKNISECNFILKSTFSKEAQHLFMSIFKPEKERATLSDVISSDFCKIHDGWRPNFINTLKQQIQVDSEVLSQIEKEHGITKQLVIHSVKNCEPNQQAAMYYLKIRQNSCLGKMSDSDLCSPNFKKSMIIRPSVHLISKKELQKARHLSSGAFSKGELLKSIKSTTLDPIKNFVRTTPLKKMKIHGGNIQLIDPEKKEAHFRVKISKPTINLKQCRLRKIDQSPESPRRILDWIGAYKRQVIDLSN